MKLIKKQRRKNVANIRKYKILKINYNNISLFKFT